MRAQGSGQGQCKDWGGGGGQQSRDQGSGGSQQYGCGDGITVYFTTFFTGLGKGKDPMKGVREVLPPQNCGGIY